MVFSYSTPPQTPAVPQSKSTPALGFHPGSNTNHTDSTDIFSYVQSSEHLRGMIMAEVNKMETWPLLNFDANRDFEHMSSSSTKHGAYILLSSCQDQADVVKDIGNQVKKLRKNWEWNPRAKFIILVGRIRYMNAKYLAEDIFGEMWASKVVNSVILIPTTDKQVSTNTVYMLDAYIWFPYQPKGNCARVKHAVLQDRWVQDSSNTGHFVHNASVFPEKIPRDIHGCPLTVSTFQLAPWIMTKKTTKIDPNNIMYDKGLEFQILTELAKSSNSSLKFRKAPSDGGRWGWDLGNGTWNGVTGEMARGYSDIAAVLLWYRCHLLTELECLRPHIIDKVVWHVPCATPYPRWMSLTRVFKLSLWLAFVAAFVIVSAIMRQIVKITSNISSEAAENQAYASLGKCLLNFWAIILEESASNNPPNVAVIRAVFLAWVLYCWAVNNVYQAYLTTFLIDPGLQHQLSTEDEILTSGIDYGTEISLIYIYPMLTGTRYRRMNVTKDLHSAEKRVAEGKHALLFSKVIVQYHIAVDFLDADGEPKVCYARDDFVFTLATTFVPKGFPFRDRYDKIVLYLLQAGLINFWWEDLQYTATLEKAVDFNLPPGEYIALTMEHLQSAFYFLLLGHAMSVISFLLELLRSYRERYETKRMKSKRI
jgi:hypothetical protein